MFCLFVIICQKKKMLYSIRSNALIFNFVCEMWFGYKFSKKFNATNCSIIIEWRKWLTDPADIQHSRFKFNSLLIFMSCHHYCNKKNEFFLSKKYSNKGRIKIHTICVSQVTIVTLFPDESLSVCVFHVFYQAVNFELN